jgi:hypothetical protein
MLLLGAVLACSPSSPPPRGTQTQEPATDAATWEDQRAAKELASDAAAVEVVAPEVAAPTASICPEGMVLVAGNYCPDMDSECLGYLDPPGPYHEYRCREYAPAQCRSPRIEMAFCIDALEYTPPGEGLPAHFVSFRDAVRTCETLGKRICLEREWNFACEGEAMLPYPYGSRRDASICNADHTDLFGPDGRTVRDRRAPGGFHRGCVSPFGVYDLSGNVEEFVARNDDPTKPVMKGAWWLPGRNHCRARQTFHNDGYKGVETGFRCCADAR